MNYLTTAIWEKKIFQNRVLWRKKQERDSKVRNLWLVVSSMGGGAAAEVSQDPSQLLPSRP